MFSRALALFVISTSINSFADAPSAKPSLNWPGWRGDGSGISSQFPTNSAVSLSGEISWRKIWETEVEGRGVSSPISISGKVIVTTASEAPNRNLATWSIRSVLAALILPMGFLSARILLLRFVQGTGDTINKRWVSASLCIPLLFAASELFVNSDQAIAKEFIKGSAARIWAVSGLATAAALATSILLAPAGSVTWRVSALAGAIWAVALCLHNPDNCNWESWPTRWVELSIATAGVFIGLLLSAPRTARVAAVSGFIGAMLLSGLAIYWHLVMDFGNALFRIRFASGLLASSVACVISYTWAKRRQQTFAPVTTSPMLRVIVGLLVAISAVHFLAANALLPWFGLQRKTVCLDEHTGLRLWTHSFPAAEPERIVPATSHATPTPVSDGSRVVSYFGPAGLVCIDLSGREVWRHNRLPFRTDFGAATSPILHNGTVILVSDSFAGSYIVGIEVTSGRELWRTTRPINLDSYGTPILAKWRDRPAVFVAGAGTIACYDAAAGTELWLGSLGRPTNHSDAIVIQSPLLVEDTILVGGDYRAQKLSSFQMPSADHGGKPSELWRTQKHVLGFASPISVSNLVFTIDNRGTISCIASLTGELIWQERIPGSYSASPILLLGRVLLLSEQGQITEILPTNEFKRISSVAIGTRTVGSPAVSNGQLLVRTPDGVAAFKRENN